MHSFATDLARSQELAMSDEWLPLYQAAFPSVMSMQFVEDADEQRTGVDRVLLSRSGVVVARVEEKVREREWPDFVLEYWSVLERRVPGWVARDLACDWLAYLFLPSSSCYLIRFAALRSAWRTHHAEWVAKYERVEARNERYTTVSVAVPRHVVLDACQGSGSMLIQRGEREWVRLAA